MYELLYILSTQYPDQELEQWNKQIIGLVEKKGGQIKKKNYLGQKRFSYPIKHTENGHYLLLEFEAEPETIQTLDHYLQLMPEILRYIIVKQLVVSSKETVTPHLISSTAPPLNPLLKEEGRGGSVSPLLKEEGRGGSVSPLLKEEGKDRSPTSSPSSKRGKMTPHLLSPLKEGGDREEGGATISSKRDEEQKETAKPLKEKKVTLEELDKKLEEILNI